MLEEAPDLGPGASKGFGGLRLGPVLFHVEPAGVQGVVSWLRLLRVSF